MEFILVLNSINVNSYLECYQICIQALSDNAEISSHINTTSLVQTDISKAQLLQIQNIEAVSYVPATSVYLSIVLKKKKNSKPNQDY